MTAKPKTRPRPVAPPVDDTDELDFDAQLDGAELPRRTVMVCLRGDLYTELQRLDLELVQFLGDGDERLGNPLARQKADEIEAVRATMLRYTVPVIIEAMAKSRFTRMEAEHPPRPDNAADMAAAANIDTMTEALLRAMIVSPKMTDAQWKRFNDKITDGQYEELGSVAWALNRNGVSIPFSRAASKVRTSGLG